MRIVSVLACCFSLIFSFSAYAEKEVSAEKNEEARAYTRAEIEQIVAETIMNNPQMIINSVQEMQTREEKQARQQAQDSVKAYEKSIFQDKRTPRIGSENADVTIVEFFDYNCGYCKRALSEIAKLVEADKKVRVLFKEYPVLAPSSEKAAKASIAFYQLNPKRYMDFHSALFNMGGNFDENSIAGVAEGMGVEKEAFLKKMHEPAIAKQIEDTRQLAVKLGARGVPMFIIGENIFPGALSYDMLKEEIDKIRIKKQ